MYNTQTWTQKHLLEILYYYDMACLEQSVTTLQQQQNLTSVDERMVLVTFDIVANEDTKSLYKIHHYYSYILASLP